MKAGVSDYFKIKTQRLLTEICIILILHWVFSVTLGSRDFKRKQFC